MTSWVLTGSWLGGIYNPLFLGTPVTMTPIPVDTKPSPPHSCGAATDSHRLPCTPSRFSSVFQKGVSNTQKIKEQKFQFRIISYLQSLSIKFHRYFLIKERYFLPIKTILLMLFYQFNLKIIFLVQWIEVTVIKSNVCPYITVPV